MKKVALVTGASSGIGKETAKFLLKDDYIVYGAARRVEQMQDIEALGVRLLPMDMANDATITQGVDRLLEQEGRLDVLVNNAGYGSYGALEDVPMSEVRYQFDVNVFGLARLTQLVLPAMRSQHSGRIINVSSMGGSFGEPHGAWYHATKYAVEGLSDCLRLELKPFNIDVVIVQPGAIKTAWGGIAREKLKDVSGNTAYQAMVAKHLQILEKAEGFASEPIVVAKTIRKVAKAKRPGSRYATGGGAKVILTLVKIIPDRLLDKLLLATMR